MQSYKIYAQLLILHIFYMIVNTYYILFIGG